MTLSAVVVSYRRQTSLEAILAAWLRETPDVWLCDCSQNGFKTALPVNIIHAWPDPGNRIRHAAALLAKGDIVVKADDDVIPLPGLGADFERAMAETGPGILGIHGRIFKGPLYYRHTKMVVAQRVPKTTRVDFVGVLTASARKYLPMDLRYCATEVEDLYWQMACYPHAPKYIISSTKFRHLDECRDAERLTGQRAGRDIRQKFYQHYYQAHYANRGKA
jgi:hypothetical protein